VSINHAAGLAFAIGLILVGVFLGWLAWGNQVVAIQEKAAAPVWHDDGSLTAIRDPSAKPDLPAPTAPRGGTLIRTVEVTVRAKPPITTHKQPITAHKEPNKDGTPSLINGDSKETITAEPFVCPAVTARLDFRKYDDGIRVSVQSDGEVLDAVDIPRSTIFVHDVKQNVVGFDVSGDRKTLRYGRALGAVDVGLQVSEEAGDLTHGGFVSFRF